MGREVIPGQISVPQKAYFTLSQTQPINGQQQREPEPFTTNWNAAQSMQTLGITFAPFEPKSATVQGHASANQISISPNAKAPYAVFFQELAHVVLGHTKTGMTFHDDLEVSPIDHMEMQAHGVSMVLCQFLNVPGMAEGAQFFTEKNLQHRQDYQSRPATD